MKGPEEFQGPNATNLSTQVLRVWIENFAWEGPEHFETDVVVGDVDDDDEFVDLLAEFVWTHRHELAHLIRESNENKQET